MPRADAEFDGRLYRVLTDCRSEALREPSRSPAPLARSVAQLINACARRASAYRAFAIEVVFVIT